jgi:uncharacterized cupredoxin-like copper-binding protein
MRRVLGVTVLSVILGAVVVGPVAVAARLTRVGVTVRDYKVVPKVSSAKAGKVRFAVSNRGTQVHELEVVRWSGKPGGIPVRDHKATFDARLSMGEVEDIDPGSTKRFTVSLPRGRYVLICNVKGHYELNMYRAFRVR